MASLSTQNNPWTLTRRQQPPPEDARGLLQLRTRRWLEQACTRAVVVPGIPVVRPDRLRYRLLHNHLDLVLTRAPRTRPDIVVARVVMPLGLRDD